MPTGERRDPLAGFRFLVELDGLIAAGFSEVHGLEAEIEMEEYREGGVNGYVHRLPKMTRQSNLTLKRGLTGSTELWDWFKLAAEGWVSRRNGSIIVLDEQGYEAWRWNFSGAYPVKWTGPELRADSSTIAVESIEIAHQGLTAYGL
ncbi:phage tail-like protein [Paenibacillus cellulosilyticus]|uniref:Phage tail-like protein n=1 Tax=Paenibacillus cellulosilyticus TaxID=375489 RepID=A0A2V2YMX0_9BACL|nr:phage tail protein [Paenibacillus cellulosilyticus]PWV95671.1 phage tail-like protein [Paenibacillus cellulosilyticus]QKS47694.1 phage tail protein [Paenibacillus cellulosilyticus]